MKIIYCVIGNVDEVQRHVNNPSKEVNGQTDYCYRLVYEWCSHPGFF